MSLQNLSIAFLSKISFIGELSIVSLSDPRVTTIVLELTAFWVSSMLSKILFLKVIGFVSIIFSSKFTLPRYASAGVISGVPYRNSGFSFLTKSAIESILFMTSFPAKCFRYI